MASRNRLRQAVSQKLAEQFKEWGLPKDIDYKSYCGIVDKPVTPKEVQKSFYNWRTAVHSVHIIDKTVFAPKPAAAPKKEAPAPKKEPAKKVESKKNDE
jgi:hypothetical protein